MEKGDSKWKEHAFLIGFAKHFNKNYKQKFIASRDTPVFKADFTAANLFGA